MLAGDFGAGRRQWPFIGLEIGEDIPKISRVGRLPQPEQAARRPGLGLDLPDSGKIGLAVQAGNRRGHVHLAIRRSRSPRHRLVQPLGFGGQGCCSDKRYSNPNVTTHIAD
jgi:hypothetical protein